MPRKNKIAVIGDTVSNRLLTHGPGKKSAIEYLSSFGFQCVHTPFQLTASMVDFIENLPGKTIRVLFNLEFLEILSERGVDMSLVEYVGDTELECRVARTVYKVGTVLADKAAWELVLEGSTNVQETFMAKMNKAADVTFTNPPYNGGVDLKIIMALKEANLLKKLVCVHPSTWLVDVKTQLGEKTGNPTFRKFRNMVREHVTRVDMFNGNPVFGIGLFVPCVITEIDFSRKRVAGASIKVKDVGCEEYREVFDIDDITVHGKYWDPTVKEFMGRVRKFLDKNGSLLDHVVRTSTCKHKSTCIQMAGIRGHVATDTMIQDDFYTFVQKAPENNKGIRKPDDRMIVFDTTQSEQENFLKYLQTDFSRLCLSLLKIKSDLDRGELAVVPWLDFTKAWDDDKLFTMLGYPKGHAIREYSKKFLPDYHGIYPNGKTY